MPSLNSRIFVSYSHRGNGVAWKDRLFAALAVFERHHLLNAWHDDQTQLGEDWHAQINAAMKSAHVAVLLLTDEFLKSPFVLQHELPELQRRYEEEAMIVAPILCEKCDWEKNTWLASLQIKPRIQTDPTPLSDFPKDQPTKLMRYLGIEIVNQISGAAHHSLATSSGVYRCRLTYHPCKRRLFLRFHAKDKSQVQGFRLVSMNPKVDLDFYDRSLNVAIDSENGCYVRRVLGEKIERTSILVCLIGNGTAWRNWIDWEIRRGTKWAKASAASGSKALTVAGHRNWSREMRLWSPTSPGTERALPFRPGVREVAERVRKMLV